MQGLMVSVHCKYCYDQSDGTPLRKIYTCCPDVSHKGTKEIQATLDGLRNKHIFRLSEADVELGWLGRGIRQRTLIWHLVGLEGPFSLLVDALGT